MRPQPHAHNSHGHFQKTSNQSAKSQEARNPAGSLSKMSWLFGGGAGNRASAKPARLSALRLSLCTIGQGAHRESARSGHFSRNGCRPAIRRHFAFSRNGQLRRSPQKYQESTGLFDAVISGYGI